MKKLFPIIASIFLFSLKVNTVLADVLADVSMVSSSAQIQKIEKVSQTDMRQVALKKYLEKHNSPLADHADEFIVAADKYDLDWRLVPAISGVESTFGKRIPYKSYNAYGWANGKHSFRSWEDSIEIVSKTLREKYYDNGTPNIAKIARRYAPPSNSWAWKVKWFMREIDSVPVQFSL
ncbi:glucosaminidase domain-containing protein [Patescibacteria group bacterium]|nr:glucosaminidase domain-containing protein [Patescibacteria group bacterium]